MTDSISIPSDPPPPSAPAGAGDQLEPLGALLVGGVCGAIGFALCALWLGPMAGIVIALVAAIIAFARRAPGPASNFVAAAALCAIALMPSTIAIFAAALCFGYGVVLAARYPRHAAALSTAAASH
jgi:hypothetical protein